MSLLDEFKKAIAGQPSRVKFGNERMQDTNAINNFAEEVRKRGYNPNVALASVGTDQEKQKQYLESLDNNFSQPQYQI